MSDLGGLSRCLVDSDAEEFSSARRLRTKAIFISLVLEVLLIAAMLLWPLITPGELPRQFNITPATPFPGGGAARSEHNKAIPSAKKPPKPPVCRALCAPSVIPPHISESAGPEPPSFDSGVDGTGENIPGATGSGPQIPGATGDQSIVIRPPEPPERSGPVHRSEGVMEASLIHRVQPAYPPIARAMHLSGTVILHAVIGADGAVHRLTVLSGNLILARAAAEAVGEWRYRPTLLSGVAVEVETEITVRFVLD